MNYEVINRICEHVDTPFYIYEYKRIVGNFIGLKASLPSNANISYSIKANPSFALCQVMSHLTPRAEASSLGEMQLALKAGFQCENIILSGPGKNYETLLFAINNDICVSVESIEEIVWISTLCQSVKKRAKIVLRINPYFPESKIGIRISGLPSQFGIGMHDIANTIAYIIPVKNIELIGLSIYLGSQILDAETIVENTRNIIKCFISIQNKYDLKLHVWNLGGGFGISYYDDKCLDLSKLRDGLSSLFKEYEYEVEDKTILFESGRYIVGDSGSFFTKILYEKNSHNKNYLICDGGFNNVLISSFFTREIRGNFPIEVVHKRDNLVEHKEKEYYICGPMCSPKDILGSKVMLSNVRPGDFLAIKKVGAYGLTFSPVYFMSNTISAEIMVKDGEHYLIRERSQGLDFLANQYGLPENFFIAQE